MKKLNLKGIWKRAKTEKIDDSSKEENNQMTIDNLFWSNFDVDIMNAKEVIVEVYRESRMEDDWEVPGSFIGIRMYEDGVVKEDIPLRDASDFGLFSYEAVQRHKQEMELAINIANFIAKRVDCFHMHDYKIKKKFTSNKHFYLLSIPSEFKVEMPEPKEHFKTLLDFEIREREIRRKKSIDPSYDTTEEMNRLNQDVEYYANKKSE